MQLPVNLSSTGSNKHQTSNLLSSTHINSNKEKKINLLAVKIKLVGKIRHVLEGKLTVAGLFFFIYAVAGSGAIADIVTLRRSRPLVTHFGATSTASAFTCLSSRPIRGIIGAWRTLVALALAFTSSKRRGRRYRWGDRETVRRGRRYRWGDRETVDVLGPIADQDFRIEEKARGTILAWQLTAVNALVEFGTIFRDGINAILACLSDEGKKVHVDRAGDQFHVSFVLFVWQRSGKRLIRK